MRLAVVLEAGRRDFLEAMGEISAEHAGVRPDPGSWSVLECIEHVIAVESRYLIWIEKATAAAPERDPDKEIRLFTIARSRLTKVATPDVFRPRRRFNTLASALAEFEAVRNRSVQLVKEQGEALYSIRAKHPYFGNLNGAEWIALIDAHTRRHADQIRETLEAILTQQQRGAKDRTSRPRAAKKPTAFRRDEPDLPDEFASAPEDHQLLVDGDLVTIREHRL